MLMREKIPILHEITDSPHIAMQKKPILQQIQRSPILQIKTEVQNGESYPILTKITRIYNKKTNPHFAHDKHQ